MPLLIGTDDGLHSFTFKDEISRRGLKGVDVRQLSTDGKSNVVHAATERGVYRIDGQSIALSGLSGKAVISVHETPTGKVFAGTRPAHLYFADGVDSTWDPIQAFEDIPGKGDWTQN
ncbi:MAG: hypothetical protein ABEI52_05205, partial [Halobacteriaceae archaeon]